MNNSLYTIFTFYMLVIPLKVSAQDLDPRAYVLVPVNTTFISAGLGFSHGSVVTDATLNFKDVNATIYTPSFGAAHSFRLLGQTAQFSGAVPFTMAEVSGSIGETSKTVTRTGFGDSRFRIAFLFHGAPASTAAELSKVPRKTILAASFSILAPSGQYFPEKLINIGTNRWAFKPELAFSQHVSNRWLFDLYAGIWLFTSNNSYYPGSSTRHQDPIGSFQTHISYNFKPGFWCALDATFYTGGKTTVDGAEKDDLQSNSRVGTTMAVPFGKRKQHAVKMAFSTGAYVTRGANFTTFSIGWQTYFLEKSK